MPRYSVAAVQTDLPNPISRQEMRRNTDRILSLLDSAVAGAAPFLPVGLVVFPEFAHVAPIYETVDELADRLAVPVPNEYTDRYVAKAKERSVYIQTGTFLEVDRRWPGVVFNTTCLIGPDGVLSKYRKVNPWLPWEVHASPHDLPGYDQPLFPVVETEIGRLGAALVERPDCFMSRRLLAECRGFVRLADGRTGARAGMHDDRVMAMAMGLAARAELAGKT